MSRSSARIRPFAQVDVFSSAPFGGNPLAVVLDAEGLDDDAMLAFARWTNLSETTFVLPPTRPEADYRVRIFTPMGELDFAGHPTLGTAAVWSAAAGTADAAAAASAESASAGAGSIGVGPDARDGGRRRIMQECAVGLVEVRADQGSFAFAAPPLRRTGPLGPDELRDAAGALGIDPSAIRDHALLDNGAGWRVVELASAEEVLALAPDLGLLAGSKLGVVGAIGAAGGSRAASADRADDGTPRSGAPAYEVRGFVGPDPRTGAAGFEDPVTGSLNAGIAQWMLERGEHSAPWLVSQGTALGRSGRVHVGTDRDGTVWIGGRTTVRISGRIAI